MARERRKERGKTGRSGRFAYRGLDRVLHEKARLGILTSLVTRPEGLLFNDLKVLCELTDGNLSRHLQVLVESELVELHKGTVDGRPQTLCRMTASGRRRFLDYVAVLEQVVADAMDAPRHPARRNLPEGFAST